MALNNLGYVSLQEGDAETAAGYFQEAVELAEARQDRRTEAFVLENLAMAKLERGMSEGAAADFAESLRLARALGFIELADTVLIGIAAIAASADRVVDAARLIGGARQMRERIGAGIDPVEARVEARAMVAISERLTPEASEAAMEEGRDLTTAELIEKALMLID